MSTEPDLTFLTFFWTFFQREHTAPHSILHLSVFQHFLPYLNMIPLLLDLLLSFRMIYIFMGRNHLLLPWDSHEFPLSSQAFFCRHEHFRDLMPGRLWSESWKQDPPFILTTIKLWYEERDFWPYPIFLLAFSSPFTLACIYVFSNCTGDSEADHWIYLHTTVSQTVILWLCESIIWKYGCSFKISWHKPV